MKDQAIRKKYPNIHSEAEYEYLVKHLKARKRTRIVSIAAFILGGIPFFGGLFCNSLFVTMIGVVMLTLFGVIIECFFRRRIDDAFLAKAAKVVVLDDDGFDSLDEAVFKAAFTRNQTKWILGTVGAVVTFLAFVVVGLLFFDFVFSKDLMIVCLAALALGALVTAAVIWYFCKQRARIDHKDYTLVLSHVNKKIESSDSDGTVFKLRFVAGAYGEFEYVVPHYVYLRTSERVDSYYLLLLPKKSRGRYKLAAAFAADQYRPAEGIAVTPYE